MTASAVETKLCMPGTSERSPISKQMAQMIIANKPILMRFSISLCSFYREKSWYIIELGEFVRRQFLGTGGNLQFETVGSDLSAGFPSPSIEGVLRPPGNLLARYDIAARVRAGSLRDPDLPINLFRSKSKMVAFDATDHTGSQILHIVDLRHQRIVRIRYQHIGSWDGPVVLVPQYVFQLIDRAGRLDLSIQIAVPAPQRQCFPVEDHLDIRKSAGAGQTKLVRAIERHSAGTRQPNFLLLCADEFEVHIIIERYYLLSAEIVGHGLEQPLGVRLIGLSSRYLHHSR